MISAAIVKELREKTSAGMMDCKNALNEANGDIQKAEEILRKKGIAKATKKESRIAAEGLANIFIQDNKAVILEVNSETDFVAKNSEFQYMIETIGKAILKSDAQTLEEAFEAPVDNVLNVKDVILAKSAKIGEKLSLRRIAVVKKNKQDYFGTYLHMGGKIAALSVINGGTEDIAKDVAMQAAAMRPQYTFEEDVPAEVLENEKEILKAQALKEGKPEDIAKKMVEGRIKKFYKEVCLNNQDFIKDNDIDIQTYLANNNAKLLKMVRYEVGEGMQKREENFAEEVMSQIK